MRTAFEPVVYRACAFACLLLILVVGAATAQKFETVPPFGTQPVGYSVFALEAGPDELTPDPSDRRRLGVEVWFPARKPGSVRKAWASDAMGAALAKGFPFPEGFHSDITTHTWRDATPVGGPLPAIVFSHGLAFPPTLYQSFFEDLASRGYAVFAVSHPHGAILIEYSDGTSLDMSLWPRIEDEAERQRMLAGAAAVWRDDLSAVIDAILSGNIPIEIKTGSPVGLAGHSLGGTAAGRLSRDERVSAIVVMEGDVRDPADENSRGSLEVTVPLLHMIGGYNRLELEGADYVPGPDAPVFTAVVRGTGHAYFSDLIHFYSGYADRDWHERHRYEVDADRVIRIVNDYMSAFFDWRMRDAPISTLLRRPSYADRVASPRRSGYPEVDLSVAVH